MRINQLKNKKQMESTTTEKKMLMESLIKEISCERHKTENQTTALQTLEKYEQLKSNCVVKPGKGGMYPTNTIQITTANKGLNISEYFIEGKYIFIPKKYKTKLIRTEEQRLELEKLVSEINKYESNTKENERNAYEYVKIADKTLQSTKFRVTRINGNKCIATSKENIPIISITDNHKIIKAKIHIPNWLIPNELSI